MNKSILLAVLLVGAALLALGGAKALQIKTLMQAGASFAPPPETVSTAVAREERWQETLEAVGSVAPVQGVTLKAELAGVVREILFESGDTVQKGDILIQLDTSTEQAQLRSLEAQAALAKIEAERLGKLHADKMVSESSLDTAEAALKQALANADGAKAAIEKKTIRAPFSGQLGIRLVNLGEFLDAGKPIVSLQSLASVYADFSLPQQELLHLRPGMKARLITDTYVGQVFEGELSAIHPEVDSTTRNVQLRASFKNPDARLRPGMFARIEVLLPSARPALVVPTTALFSSPYGDTVFVIESAKGTNAAASRLVARQQFVRTGQSRGDFVSIEAGLHPGERVATSGVFKLRNGMAVTENNKLIPDLQEHPQPADG